MFDKRHELAKLLVVADTGTIIGAAEKLAITQPALSRIISKLEEQCRGQLFERTSTGVRLTQLGTMVTERARRILSEIEAAEEEINLTLTGQTGSLSITADPVWAETILPAVVCQFHRLHPEVELSVGAVSYSQGIRRLVSGESDLHCGSIGANGLWSPLVLPERLLKTTWCVVAHESHPLHAATVACEDLLGYQWIDYDTVADGGLGANGDVKYDDLPSLAHVMDELHRETGRRAKVVIRTNLSELSMLEDGRYLSYLPLAALDKPPGASIVPLPTELGRRCYHAGIVSRRSSRALSAYVDMRRIVQAEAARTLTPGSDTASAHPDPGVS